MEDPAPGRPSRPVSSVFAHIGPKTTRSVGSAGSTAHLRFSTPEQAESFSDSACSGFSGVENHSSANFDDLSPVAGSPSMPPAHQGWRAACDPYHTGR